jgi:hypothetical protein
MHVQSAYSLIHTPTNIFLANYLSIRNIQAKGLAIDTSLIVSSSPLDGAIDVLLGCDIDINMMKKGLISKTIDYQNI